MKDFGEEEEEVTSGETEEEGVAAAVVVPLNSDLFLTAEVEEVIESAVKGGISDGDDLSTDIGVLLLLN